MTWILSSIRAGQPAWKGRKACGRIQSGPEFKTTVQSPFPASEKSKTVPRIREAQERSVQRRNAALLNPVCNTNHVSLSLLFLVYVRSRSVSCLPVITGNYAKMTAGSYTSRYASSLCLDETPWHPDHCYTHNGHCDLMLSSRVILVRYRPDMCVYVTHISAPDITWPRGHTYEYRIKMRYAYHIKILRNDRRRVG